MSKQLIFIGQNTLMSISLSGRLKLTQNVIMKGFTISYYDFLFEWTCDIWTLLTATDHFGEKMTKKQKFFG